MRRRLSNWLTAAWRKLNPRNPVPLLMAENRALSQALGDKQAREAQQLDHARKFLAEIAEAQSMCGSGPWHGQYLGGGDVPKVRLPVRVAESLGLAEAGPIGDAAPLGAYGMYELLLQNVQWQREINYSWLEFTRWGIQQIILICRLYYLKNPIPRRLTDVIAQYVFARGFDITTDDESANDEIKDFMERNRKVLGHVALTAQQRSKITDGNLFWVMFTDPGDGKMDLRLIDATEIQDIWTDPDDADTPQYYQRIWTSRAHDVTDGSQATRSQQAWYPAINFDPGPNRPMTIKGYPVMWDSPVYHRKIGTVGKWLFGCPPMYPMLDWAKESRHYLESCASVAQSLAQFATVVTTKGGQQAIEGVKQQMQTQVGPGSPIYDTNPEAVAGGGFVSGPGTTLKAFSTQGAGLDPEKVRRYLLFCCMVLGMPETFLGDVSTGNLATATSLDRPTETVFLSIQEEWIEDLTVIVQCMLQRSAMAAGGKLRESANGVKIRIVAAPRHVVETPSGARKWAYREAGKKDPATIEVRVDFPAIREGDAVAETNAIVEAMTLGNKGGQIVGIDEKEGVKLLYKARGVQNGDEIAEEQYPDKPGGTGKDKYKAYDPNRMVQVLPPPIMKTPDQPGVQPQPGAVSATVATKTGVQPAPPPMKEAILRATARLNEAVATHLDDEEDD
jgi:hypothetical protein